MYACMVFAVSTIVPYHLRCDGVGHGQGLGHGWGLATGPADDVVARPRDSDDINTASRMVQA